MKNNNNTNNNNTNSSENTSRIISQPNAQVGAPVERVDSPRLDRRDDSFPDFDTVSANTNEFGTHLSFWKHGKSYPEISLPMNLELGQAIFVGLERYVKRHYPNMALFQQECPPSPCSTEPKKQTLFCGLFDWGLKHILRFSGRSESPCSDRVYQ